MEHILNTHQFTRGESVRSEKGTSAALGKAGP